MNRLLIHAALAGIVLAMQGCQSGGTWTKSGADPSMVSNDMEECRKLALFRANPPVAPSGSPNARTDISRPGAVGGSAGSNERFVNEQEEIRRCMLRKGYELKH